MHQVHSAGLITVQLLSISFNCLPFCHWPINFDSVYGWKMTFSYLLPIASQLIRMIHIFGLNKLTLVFLPECFEKFHNPIGRLSNSKERNILRALIKCFFLAWKNNCLRYQGLFRMDRSLHFEPTKTYRIFFAPTRTAQFSGLSDRSASDCRLSELFVM